MNLGAMGHWPSIQGSRAVCVKKTPEDATTSAKRKVDYSSGTASMRANELFEPEFRRWVRERLTLNGSPIPKKDILNGGAEVTGCSQPAARRYLDKMTSPEGELEEFKEGHKWYVFWKGFPRKEASIAQEAQK